MIQFFSQIIPNNLKPMFLHSSTHSILIFRQGTSEWKPIEPGCKQTVFDCKPGESSVKLRVWNNFLFNYLSFVFTEDVCLEIWQYISFSEIKSVTIVFYDIALCIILSKIISGFSLLGFFFYLLCTFFCMLCATW